MFVQVIEARTSDPEGLRKQLDKWMAELRPGATGYIGTTSGVAADGRTGDECLQLGLKAISVP